MSDPTFNQPQSGGGYFDSKNHIGSLILITRVHEVYHNAMNVYQGKPAPRDEAKVDVVDLDRGDLGYELKERVIMTHPGLVNRLSANATNILGRVTMESGVNGDYYALQPYEPQDVDKATRWVNWWTAQQMKQPQAQAAPQPQAQAMPPQQQGQEWGGQNPQAQAPQQQQQQQMPGYGGQAAPPQGGGPTPWGALGNGVPQPQSGGGQPWGNAGAYPDEPPF